MEITKEALAAFTEATIKSATEMEKIVGTLHILIEKQDKIVDRLMNGMVQEIIDGVVVNYNNTHKDTIECLKRIEEYNKEVKTAIPIVVKEAISNSEIARDIEHVKWFVGIVGIIVILASIILRGIDNRALLSQEIKAMKQVITTEESLKK